MKVVSFSLCLVWLLLSSSIIIMCEAQDNTDTTTTNTTDTNTYTANTTDTTTTTANTTTNINITNKNNNNNNNNNAFEDQFGDDLSDEDKVWFHENFKIGTGNVLDGHFTVKLNENAAADMMINTTERVAIQDRIDQLLNETGIDSTHIKIRHKMELIFRGFSWQEHGPVINNQTLRYSILMRLLNHSLVEFIEQVQQVGTSCTASWGLDRIDQKSLPMDGVYRHDWDGASVDVYVLDTGVHESKLLQHVRSFVYKDNNIVVIYYWNNSHFLAFLPNCLVFYQPTSA
jgi:hypothetical protein